MFLEIFLGGVPRTGYGAAWIVRPPKSRFFKTDQTPLELGKGTGKHKGKYRGLGLGVWCLTLTHAVAQSAVADIYIYTSVDLSIKWTNKKVNITLQRNRSLRGAVRYPQTGNRIK